MDCYSLINWLSRPLFGLAALSLLGCGSDAGDGANSTPEALVIGGIIVGLPMGQSLVLQNNARDNLTVSANGNFSFPALASSGTSYDITILSQPRGQHCIVKNAKGTVGAANLPPMVNCPHFAYVTHMLSNIISAYAIQPELGTLLPLAEGVVASGAGPSSLTVEPYGRFAYVTNTWGNSISAYRINSESGALSEVAGSPFRACGGPSSLSIDPDGYFLYVSNSGYSGSLCGFSIDQSSGALSPIAGSPFEAGAYPSRLKFAMSGRFAYVTSAGGCLCVYAYRVDTVTGVLHAVGTYANDNPTVAVVVDANGRYIYLANYMANNILAYSIDHETGALARVSGSPYPAGIFPSRVTLSADGKFAYVANSGFPASVSSYRIDAGTGSWGPLTPSQSAPAQAYEVVLSPSGQFAYVVGGAIGIYAVDLNSGALTEIPGSNTIMSGESFHLDPTGNFAYQLRYKGDQLAAFRLSQNDGMLTEIEGGGITTSGGQQSITIW